MLVSAREPFQPSAARLVAVPPAASSAPALPSGATPSPAIMESGERQVAKSSSNEHVDDTLLSGRGVVPGVVPGASPTGEAEHGDAKVVDGGAIQARKRQKSLAIAGLGLVGVVTAVGVALRVGVAPPGPHSEETFRLHLESEPRGADVFEGDGRLGTTPIDLPIARSSVNGKARHFALRLPGYRDAQWVQGASPEDIRVQVNLAKDEAGEQHGRSRLRTSDEAQPAETGEVIDGAQEGSAAASPSAPPSARSVQSSPGQPRSSSRATGKKTSAPMGSVTPSTTTPDIRTKR
ncbi:MAG: hypothetical protein QM784_34545 [Polyangiaceae bacterium]